MSTRTPGPWGLRGNQIRSDDGLGQHVATYQISCADGLLIAAAPALLEMLLDQITVHESCGGCPANAWAIRGRLAQLGLARLGSDRLGYESTREDLASTDPDVEVSPWRSKGTR